MTVQPGRIGAVRPHRALVHGGIDRHDDQEEVAERAARRPDLARLAGEDARGDLRLQGVQAALQDPFVQVAGARDVRDAGVHEERHRVVGLLLAVGRGRRDRRRGAGGVGRVGGAACIRSRGAAAQEQQQDCERAPHHQRPSNFALRFSRIAATASA